MSSVLYLIFVWLCLGVDFVLYYHIFIPLVRKSRHYFNYQVKSIVADHYQTRYQTECVLNLAIYTVYTIRAGYILVGIVRTDLCCPLIVLPPSYDLVRYYLLHFSTGSDYFFVVTFCAIYLYGMALEYRMLIATPAESVTWGLFYDLVVINGDAYSSCQKPPEVKERIFSKLLSQNRIRMQHYIVFISEVGLGLLCKGLTWAQIWFQGRYVDKRKFSHTGVFHFVTKLSVRT